MRIICQARFLLAMGERASIFSHACIMAASGLSEGLWQAGVCIPCWAIDNDVEAATAYQMNHPDCTVFVEDCNVFLRQLFDVSCRVKRRMILFLWRFSM